MMSSATVRAEPGFLAKTFVLARKDLRIEARARDTLPPMLAFALAVTLLLAFTLPAPGPLRSPIDVPAAGTVRLADVLAGFLWITVLFAGLIGFARTFETERRDGALEVMLLVPLDRSGLFAAKAAANFVYIALVEILLFPAFAILFGVELGSSFGPLVLVALLVDVGFVSTGTLFASLAARTRSRELILPILALPAIVPVFIAAVELSSDLFLGGGFAAVTEGGWFAILIVFDIVFTTVGALAFEFAVEP
jgi:heme exporter protein B